MSKQNVAPTVLSNRPRNRFWAIGREASVDVKAALATEDLAVSVSSKAQDVPISNMLKAVAGAFVAGVDGHQEKEKESAPHRKPSKPPSERMTVAKSLSLPKGVAPNSQIFLVEAHRLSIPKSVVYVCQIDGYEVGRGFRFPDDALARGQAALEDGSYAQILKSALDQCLRWPNRGEMRQSIDGLNERLKKLHRSGLIKPMDLID